MCFPSIPVWSLPVLEANPNSAAPLGSRFRPQLLDPLQRLQKSLRNSAAADQGLGLLGIFRHGHPDECIHSGIVWINTYRVISPITPFGGFGQSGYGREAGKDAIYDYTRTKTVWVNTSEEPMANPFVMP